MMAHAWCPGPRGQAIGSLKQGETEWGQPPLGALSATSAALAALLCRAAATALAAGAEQEPAGTAGATGATAPGEAGAGTPGTSAATESAVVSCALATRDGGGAAGGPTIAT